MLVSVVGKDSTAMVLRLLEEGQTVDDIIYIDTGKDFPQMYEHVDKVDQYIQERYGKTITRLKADKSFDYYMFEHTLSKGNRQGQKGYGWSSMFNRWCTWALKNEVIDKYLKKYEEGYTKYVGIAYDEPKRIKNDIYPLVEWKMTEKDCLQYCYDRGFDWGGLYQKFDRLSCWCCPLKNQKELKILWKEYPELWEELKEMDRKAHNTFKKNYTVEELEERFKQQEKQTSLYAQ